MIICSGIYANISRKTFNVFNCVNIVFGSILISTINVLSYPSEGGSPPPLFISLPICAVFLCTGLSGLLNENVDRLKDSHIMAIFSFMLNIGSLSTCGSLTIGLLDTSYMFKYEHNIVSILFVIALLILIVIVGIPFTFTYRYTYDRILR